MKWTNKRMAALKVYFAPALLALPFALYPATSNAFGVLDYLDMSLKAVNKTGSKAYSQVMERFVESAKSSVSLVYEGVNETGSPLNPNDRLVITKMVDAVITPDGKSTAYNAASSSYLENFHLIKSALSTYESVATAVDFASTARSLGVNYSKMNAAAESLGTKIAQGQPGVLDALVGLYYGTRTLSDIASIDDQLQSFANELASKSLSAAELGELIAAVIGQSGLYTQRELSRIEDKNNALYKRLVLQEAAIVYLREQTGKSPADLRDYAVIKATYDDGGFFGRANYSETPSNYGYVYSTNHNLSYGGTWGGSYPDFVPPVPVTGIDNSSGAPVAGQNDSSYQNDRQKDNVSLIEQDSISDEIIGNHPGHSGPTEADGSLTHYGYEQHSGILTSNFEAIHDRVFPNKGVAWLTDEYGAHENINWVESDVNLTYAPQGDYHYTAWGQWSGSGSGLPAWVGKGGDMVLGIETPQVNLQGMSGSALFKGDVKGQYSGSSGAGKLGGTVRINVNFGQKTVNGALFIKRAADNSNFATPTFATSFNAQGKYNGTLSNLEKQLQSGIQGRFYGPKAEETGGNFYFFREDANHGIEGATGVFRAKQ